MLSLLIQNSLNSGNGFTAHLRQVAAQKLSGCLTIFSFCFTVLMFIHFLYYNYSHQIFVLPISYFHFSFDTQYMCLPTVLLRDCYQDKRKCWKVC